MEVTRTAVIMSGLRAAGKEKETRNSTMFFSRSVSVVQTASVAAVLLVTSIDALSIFLRTF